MVSYVGFGCLVSFIYFFTELRVVYNIKAPQAPEGSYGLIFTLIRKERKYLFQGMLVQ